MAISVTLREFIAKRDKNRCAYCQTSEENCGLRMHIDHIIPEAASGPSTPDNLCLICFACNVYKSDAQQGVDPETNGLVSLFHPFLQAWEEHFVWDERQTQIIGLTSTGRATIATLRMNNDTVVKARRRWVSGGWHPPT